MKGAQQVIKGFAIAIAVVLMLTIFSALVGAGTIMSHIFGGHIGGEVSEWNETIISTEQREFDELVIDLKSTSLRLEYGDEFEVRADEEVIALRYVDKKIYIEEQGFDLFFNWHRVGGEVKVVLPRSTKMLKQATISTGAGAVYIKELVAEDLELDLGAGKVEIDDLIVRDKTRIDGGTGLVLINSALLNDIDFDIGVGRFAFTGEVTGRGDIDAGVGKLELNLVGTENDYRLRLHKGIGAIIVNGDNIGNDVVWGSGEELIEIDGGVGAIEVKTVKRTNEAEDDDVKSENMQRGEDELNNIKTVPERLL